MMNNNNNGATTMMNRNAVVPSSSSSKAVIMSSKNIIRKEANSNNNNNIKIISTSSTSTSTSTSSSDWWIDQVLDLQKSNHKHELLLELDDSKMMLDDGFLTVRHEKSDLIEMAKYCPQFLAVVDIDDDSDDKNHSDDRNHHPKVIGYTLTVDRNTLIECPNLANLYKIFFDMADDVIIKEDDDATAAAATGDEGSSSSSLDDDDVIKDKEETKTAPVEQVEAVIEKEETAAATSTDVAGLSPSTSSSSSSLLDDDVIEKKDYDATAATATDVAGLSTSSSSSPSLLKNMNMNHWVLGAQVCVSKNYRRRGILQKLYDMQMNQLAKFHNVDFAIVTAVDHANNASLKAHSKANFITLKRFDTGGKDNTGWSLIIRTTRPLNNKVSN